MTVEGWAISGPSRSLVRIAIFVCRKKIRVCRYEGNVLQDMMDKVIEIGRCYGMEMNVEKTKVMRISRQPLPVKIMIDQKTTRECGIF